MGRLNGKVAIITGGARGLGKAFCHAIADEGAKVMVADILEQKAEKTVKEILAKGGISSVLKVDITSEQDTLRMAEETVEQFGRIDILVNNAAMIYGISKKPFHEIPLDEYDRLMSVNLKGPFLCCRAVFPFMKKQGKGKIINLSSTVAFGGAPIGLHYITSKGGMISFTRSLAGELGPHGICVNALAPGFIDSESSRKNMGDLSKFPVFPIPMKRLGLPGDLIGTVIFLASEDSDFITGQTIVVDGGRYMR